MTRRSSSVPIKHLKASCGEPIVCTPDDALNTFYNSGIDVLILGRFAIFK